jgi:hypothetical protein
LRKALAVVLILILVLPLLYSVLTLISVSGWALKRSFYRGILGEERLYAALLSEASARKDLPWDIEGRAPGFERLPAEALAKALSQTVRPAYLRDQALDALDDFFAAAEGREADFDLDLGPLKSELAGPSRRAFARALAEALPVCQTGQDPLAPGTRLLSCRPSGVTVERASQLIHDALPSALEQVGDRLPYGAWAGMPTWVDPLGAARLGWAAVVLALIAAGFWVGAAFVGGSTRAEVTAFLGWSLLPPALLTLAGGLAVRPALGWLPLLGPWLPGDASWPSRELVSTLAEMLRPALQAVARGFLITGAVSLGLSLGLIVWWWIIRQP